MTQNYKHLPSKNGQIDWDIVCEDYHSYILSPFAPEMLTNDHQGKSRNLLLNYLNAIPDKELCEMDVLDFGCGPGNLIPHLANKTKTLVGLDLSKNSLKIAARLASELTANNFKSICSNLLELDSIYKFDLVISSNSILPTNRNEVTRLLTKIHDCLKPGGKLVAILPSFDTTIYLQSLRDDLHNKLIDIKDNSANPTCAFSNHKLMDAKTLSYADDGKHIQCYHTKESIIQETFNSGLRVLIGPEKVYYPWKLTQKFDYGYFPDAREEIWDWFIVAGKEN